MERSSTFAPTILQRWTHRENLLPGLALATAGWVYVAYQSSSMGSMAIEGTGGGVVFLSGWTAIDCLDCCAGLMVGLVALGMMNLAWMLTAAAVILVDKTIPGSHRIARFLGVLMVVGGVGLLGASLLSGVAAQMEPV